MSVERQRIFVTGGAGFIGSCFVRLALEAGHEVVTFDTLTYAGNLINLEGVLSQPRHSFVRGDVTDASAVREAMDGCEWVVNFAAESHVDRSIEDREYSCEPMSSGLVFYWMQLVCSAYIVFFK